VVALYLFGHVPAAEQAELIQSVATWLRSRGFFLATFGAGGASEAIDEDWLGVPMFFASLAPDAYSQVLQSAGLEPIREEVVVQDEPGHGEVGFRWVLARAS
jgi:hypothetical protein